MKKMLVKNREMIEKNINVNNCNELAKFFFNEKNNIFLSIERNENIIIDLKIDKITNKILKELSLNYDDAYLTLNEKKGKNLNPKRIYFLFFFKKTFDQIEKIILSKKIEFILSNNSSALVLCDSCSEKRGNYICRNCGQILCIDCKTKHLTNKLWEEHIIESLYLEMNNNFEGKGDLQENAYFNYVIGESFSFPTYDAQNIGYDDLLKLFDVLYYQYINLNGINIDNNSLSTKGFIQLKLEFFTKFEIAPKKALENDLENILNNIPYNWTEIFYANRICFKNFKFYGTKATIEKVFLPLKILQGGKFDDKLKILLNILDIYDNKIILKTEIQKYFAFAFYQACSYNYTVEKLLDIIYPFDSKFIDLIKLYELIYSNLYLLTVFQTLLQCLNE